MAFDTLPNNARLWVFSFSEALSDEQETKATTTLKEFFSRWKSHGSSVEGDFEIHYKRFILVAADENSMKTSGCGIDSLFNVIKEVSTEIALPLSETATIFYKDKDSVEAVSRDEFKNLVAKNAISNETLVFDNTVQELADIREGRWERPLETSWHAKLAPPR